MAPKFKGGSDDWLDDQKSARRSGSKKKGAKLSEGPLPAADANATVIEVFPKLCKVRLDADGGFRLCSYRRANVMAPDPDGVRSRAPVSAGDRVKVTSTDPQSGVVEGVCERLNFLARPAPDKDGKLIHVLASNLDVLVIVASVHQPDFSPGLVDRFWIAAIRAGIPVIVVASKFDLWQGGPDRPWALYEKLGLSVYEVCSKTGNGVEEVLQALQGKRVVFCGHSGVGKTSLLNSLLGGDIGKVGDTNEFTGKGRHTTTSAVLIEGPGGASWIDTPGVREFGLWGIDPDGLRDFFPEFGGLPCTGSGCTHQEHETECQARELPRHPNYLRILQSLLEDREEKA
ncbi:MAG: ribosome small subunit-dependent GTPase A [Bdellovibrionales bacterium]|nr:ribosome small subunit-dependent GTPase A [Bdellovibrionales bacterium]